MATRRRGNTNNSGGTHKPNPNKIGVAWINAPKNSSADLEGYFSDMKDDKIALSIRVDRDVSLSEGQRLIMFMNDFRESGSKAPALNMYLSKQQ